MQNLWIYSNKKEGKIVELYYFYISIYIYKNGKILLNILNINLIDKKKMGQCNKSINNNELFQTIEFKMAYFFTIAWQFLYS